MQPGVVLGGDGFGYTAGSDGSPRHVPHVGRVVIEDDVEIGANTTIDRGTYGATVIGEGTKIDAVRKAVKKLREMVSTLCPNTPPS